MDIGVRDKNGFHIIDIVGKIDRLKDSIVLKSYIETRTEQGATRIAVNVKKITYLDSGALNVIIYCHHHLQRRGGRFVIIEPNEYVLDVLAVVGFDKLITIFSSEKEFLKNAKKI